MMPSDRLSGHKFQKKIKRHLDIGSFKNENLAKCRKLYRTLLFSKKTKKNLRGLRGLFNRSNSAKCCRFALSRAITPDIKHTEMKSRITIEVDFNNGNRPVIQIIRNDSEDVRDRLITSFLQTLNGSSWLKIQWQGPGSEDRIFISPIPGDKLKPEAQEMLDQVKIWDEFEEMKGVNNVGLLG